MYIPRSPIDVIICLSSSTGSIGTSLTSQSSHLNKVFLLLLDGKPFFLRHSFLEEHYFSLFFFSWALFYMYEHVVEYLPQAQRNTAKQVHTCRSERGNASKQTELARASMSSSIHAASLTYSTALSLRTFSRYFVYT